MPTKSEKMLIEDVKNELANIQRQLSGKKIDCKTEKIMWFVEDFYEKYEKFCREIEIMKNIKMAFYIFFGSTAFVIAFFNDLREIFNTIKDALWK